MLQIDKVVDRLTKKPIILIYLTIILVAALVIVTCGGSMDNKPWLLTSATINGSVTLPDGVDKDQVHVTLDETRMVMADSEGNFTFTLVPPGSHLIDIEYLAHLYTGSKWLTVGEGEDISVVVQLEENVTVGNTLGGLTADDIPDLPNINVQDITGDGDIVVLCDNDNGFEAIDVSDPAAPSYLGRNEDGRNCDSLIYDPPYLYTGWNDGIALSGGIAIYDLSDPSSPEKVGESITDNVVWAIDKYGDHIVALGRSLFQVYSISDLSHPSLMATLPLRGEGADVDGDFAYLATDPQVLTVVDISDPASPWIVWQSEETGFGVDSVVVGDNAYVAASGVVYQYDIRLPADPRLVNAVDVEYLESQGASLGGVLNLEGMTSEGHNVYLGAVFNGMVVVSYADPLRPRFAWESASPDVPFAMNVYIVGDLAHVAAWTEGYRIVKRK